MHRVVVAKKNKRTSLTPLNLIAAMLAGLMMLSAAPALAAKYAGVVVDARTGKILYESDARSLRYPASLTKMMTLYLTFEALESGRISLDSAVPVSANAAKEPPSKLGVRAGGSITVEQAIKSLVTRSANDMATALGEYVGGSEKRFAQLMTAKARSLGMKNTTYRNANGLPNTAQMTTAYDQALLGIALRQHFPQYYGYFSTRSFHFGKQTIGNHNRLLGAVRGVDGIKTGYTRASGFNLATSAQADGRSIVAVVLGGTTGARRDATMRDLVAKYMPRASRSGATTFHIAKNRLAMPSAGGAIALSALDLPKTGPLPVTRYDIASEAVEDAVTETAFAAAGAASPAQQALDRVASAHAPMPLVASVPVPAPAPAFMPDAPQAASEVTASTPAVAEESRAASVAVDDTVTGSTEKQLSGWVIQVGTSPNKDQANELLRNAQGKGGKVLRSATPFTVAYDTGSKQIYRARFGGFDNQKTAVNACRTLKKVGFGCWAAMQ